MVVIVHCDIFYFIKTNTVNRDCLSLYCVHDLDKTSFIKNGYTTFKTQIQYLYYMASSATEKWWPTLLSPIPEVLKNEYFVAFLRYLEFCFQIIQSEMILCTWTHPIAREEHVRMYDICLPPTSKEQVQFPYFFPPLAHIIFSLLAWRIRLSASTELLMIT